MEGKYHVPQGKSTKGSPLNANAKWIRTTPLLWLLLAPVAATEPATSGRA